MRFFKDALQRLPADIRLSRRGMFGVVAFSALFLAACSAGVQTTKVGDFDVAPDFELAVFENINYGKGERVSVSGFEGKPIVVNFWYPSCPPCRLEMPELEKLYPELQAAGVDLLGISLDTGQARARVQRFLDRAGITYPNFTTHQSSLEQLFTGDQVFVPVSFVIDAQGRIDNLFSGWSRESEAAIRKLIR